MSQQLVKKGTNGRYSNVMPKSWIEAIKDKNTGKTLVEILQSFNMYFLPYDGNSTSTRCLVPTMLRKKGLWITYVKYDGNVYTEWYASEKIDDKSWGNSSNWRIGNNTLVGDITISANGNWVINGTETEFKAVGEKGNTPLLRVANNRLQVSYDLGDTYIDVTNNPVYTKFRWLATTGDTQANNVGRIQASTDEGKTWTNMSNDFTNNLHISRYIGVNESLPTSGIAEGTIYAKGPYYAEDDTLNDNPIYRLWVYAWKGGTLAWQDNGEFTSIAAGVVQETGDSETAVMSQKAVSTKLSEIGQKLGIGLNRLSYGYNNGYVTSSSSTVAIVEDSSDNYRYVTIPVNEGEKFIFYQKNISNKSSLIVFTDSSKKVKVGRNINAVEEYTELTAPSGASFLAITTKFGVDDEDTNIALYSYYSPFVEIQKNSAIVPDLNKKVRNLEYNSGTIINGYVTTLTSSVFLSHTPETDDYLVFVKRVVPHDKIVIYMDALFDGVQSLSAFTDSENPMTGNKLGNNLVLSVGYNEVIVPENATYIGVTLKFADRMGEADKKIISSYTDYSTTKKIQNLELKTGNIGYSLLRREPLSTTAGKFLESDGILTDISDVTYMVSEYEVKPFQLVHVKSYVYKNKAYASFIDKDNNVVKYYSDNNNTDFRYVDTTFEVPLEAVKLLIVGRYSNYPSAEIYQYSINAKWYNKKWCCVGDSLTETNSRTKLNYHDYIAESTGIEVINLGRSGSGYARLKDSGNAFFQRIESIPTDVDVITIFGSGNDLSSGLALGNITDSGTETLCGYINKTIDAVKENYPLIPFGIVTPTPWIGLEPSQAPNAMSKYANAIVEICKMRGIPCLNLYYCSNLHPSDEGFRKIAYSKDDGNGVHPDENGHKIIAPRFLAFLDSLILPNLPNL